VGFAMLRKIFTFLVRALQRFQDLIQQHLTEVNTARVVANQGGLARPVWHAFWTQPD